MAPRHSRGTRSKQEVSACVWPCLFYSVSILIVRRNVFQNERKRGGGATEGCIEVYWGVGNGKVVEEAVKRSVSDSKLVMEIDSSLWLYTHGAVSPSIGLAVRFLLGMIS